MALRTGYAAASLLGVVTTFGTPLWVATVGILVVLVVGLVTLEVYPRIQAAKSAR